MHILLESGCFSQAPFSSQTNSFPALSTVFLSAYCLQPECGKSLSFDRKMICRPCLCVLIKEEEINVFISLSKCCPMRKKKKHQLKYILHTAILIWCTVYFCSILVMKLWLSFVLRAIMTSFFLLLGVTRIKGWAYSLQTQLRNVYSRAHNS